MKKRAGFSLIELVITMALLGLVMGGLVSLFGGSVASLNAGTKQEVVYEEARLLMNELKTTLRYAKNIDPLKPVNDTTQFEYSGEMWNKPMEINGGDNKEYKIVVTWKDSQKKQLKITRKYGDNSEKESVFPQNPANSKFDSNSPFHIIAEEVALADGSSVVMYNIALPLKYVIKGATKEQTLTTKVTPLKDDDNETLEEKMLRLYREVLTVGIKMKAHEQLTGTEDKLRNDVETFFGQTGNYYFTNNDNIRRYLVNQKFSGTWPTKNINGEDVYVQAYCDFSNGQLDLSDVFVYGSALVKDTSTRNWNTNHIYDMEAKNWYSGGTGIMIADKPWLTVKNEMQTKGWTNVN